MKVRRIWIVMAGLALALDASAQSSVAWSIETCFKVKCESSDQGGQCTVDQMPCTQPGFSIDFGDIKDYLTRGYQSETSPTIQNWLPFLMPAACYDPPCDTDPPSPSPLIWYFDLDDSEVLQNEKVTIALEGIEQANYLLQTSPAWTNWAEAITHHGSILQQSPEWSQWNETLEVGRTQIIEATGNIDFSGGP